MARSSTPPFRPLVAYSTNVHRGETLADVYRFLREYTLPVKRRTYPEGKAGLELRVGIGSSRDLEKPGTLLELKDYLATVGLVPFSINAYPLRNFHSRRVKEQVYLPSWLDRERSDWTSRIARQHAVLLPEGVAGSISTLGGCFRRVAHDDRARARMARNYLRTVRELARIEADLGKSIVLAVEPEPDTTFETASDVIAFFERFLLPAARRDWRREGLRPGAIEERLRRFFTVNYDTCHISVLYEDTVANLEALWRAGIEVGKVHVTSAIAVERPHRARQAYEQFRGMDEPRYFHQFCGRDGAGRIVWRGLDLRELPARLDPDRHPPVAELRSHYHVPLYADRWRRLRTTREETRAAVEAVVRRRRCAHLVTETYTWPILATEGRLVSGIAREIDWLEGVLGSLGTSGRG